MQEIELRLAIDDVNLILEGLGNLQFAKVYTVIGKIQEQAARQIRATNGFPAEAAPAARA
jgi:hypothetical protein